MKKIVWINFLLLLALLIGCQENWDDFYEGNDERQAGADGNLYEVLQQYPKRYSKFLELIDKAEVDIYLKSDRVLTVWAPHNDYVTDEVMALEGQELKRFVLNHMTSLAIYRTKLATKNSLQTLAEKYISVDRAANGYIIDKMPIRKYDVAATNGVIHEIGGVLEPLKNIMEYINEAGSEFSLFRDSLWAYNDTIFKPELSFPLGVNDVGQTIYDSVFVIQNDLLGNVDPAEEDSKLTLFLPSNTVIDDMLKQTKTYYDGIGREFLKADSMAVYKWIMRATFFRGQMENLSRYKSLTGVGGSLVKFDKQIVRTNYDLVSNGVVYLYEEMYMPRSGLITPFDYKPIWLFDLPKEERDKYYTVFDNSTINSEDNIFVDNNNKSHEFLSIPVEEEEWVEVRTLTKNIDAEVIERKVMPGKYKMSGRYYGYRGANIKLYINGDPQEWKEGGLIFPTGGNANFNYTSIHDIVDTVTIRERSGYNMLNIRMESAGTGSAKFIRFSHLRFEPVGDNY